MEDLKDGFRVRAINLFGYGKTPAWPDGARQSLDGHARLVGAVLAPDAEEVHLVGHSFGGGAPEETRYHAGAPRPDPVYLVAQSGRTDAFAEAMALRDASRNSARSANGVLRRKGPPTIGVASVRGRPRRPTAARHSRKR
jgi:pimeloyl-ACP methyl ester carboxylesterase